MVDQRLDRKFNFKVLMAVYLLIAIAIFIKLSAMQIFSASYYRRASLENSVRIVPIKAPRGIILDRFGNIIVRNRPSYSMYLVPYQVPDIKLVAAKLANFLNVDKTYLQNTIVANWKNKFLPIRLRRDIDFTTLSILEEHSLDLPGVAFQIEPTRMYPDSGIGSHFLGYIGEVYDKEIETNPDYRSGDLVGKKGIEKQYDSYLRGRDGLSYLEVTAQGRVLGKYPEKEDVEPISGATLTLNIDLEMQKLADHLLDSCGQGAVVVMDVNTGGVLTLASSPEFDANLFSGFISPDKWNEIVNDPAHPLLNRGIQATYPPGSTMKIFTAGMALYFDKVSAERGFDACRGAKRFGNRVFKCWRPEGHGRLDLHGAIVQSCDIYFYQMGLACGMELWEKFMPMCHLGQLTGIDIPGEKPGNSPSIKYYDNRYGKNGWTKIFIVNLAIGQGEVLVTPVQMATLYAAVGNGGTIYQPQIVKKITDSYGTETIISPKETGKLPLTQAQLDFLVEAMTGVTEEGGGTARGVQLPGISVAGKTGTAQNPHGKEHSWFVCIAPAVNPEISIAVLVENAGHGSTVAAPLAKRILQYYFKIPTKPIA
ncbi:MAG: penicillin-binding protein 2 [candidate division Zixibacteria bacterium]|nr:penicillin-binding protein 2 [candidate division Zixibacteria bacterium]